MKILLATDGSKQADAAIEACAKFVKSIEKVKIISVVEPRYVVGAEPYAVSAEFYQEVQETERKHANQYLDNSVAKLKESFGVETPEIISELFFGNAGQTIVEEAKNFQADLIIVGSHGYGFWQRALLGSVSDAVLHHASCSVLVVKTPES